jgi:acetyl esterase
MPVDPALVPFLPFPPLPDEFDLPTWRSESGVAMDGLISQVGEPGPEVAERRVETIPVEGGSIELVIYRPVEEETLPVHIYLHGGGFIAGSALDSSVDNLARERAVGAHCVVVAVNYRKAPEHPHPSQLLDSQAAFEWVLDNAEYLGIDRNRVTVGGASSGANLTAALMLKLRDEDGPKVLLQLLEVPALDLTLSLPAHSDPDLGTKYALAYTDIGRFISWYLGDEGDPRDPYVSPLLAPDISGLPPAYVLSAEFDVLREDGERYVSRLHEAGVPAVFSRQLGHVHPSLMFTKLMASSRAWRDEVVDVLRAANDGSLDLTNARTENPAA